MADPKEVIEEETGVPVGVGAGGDTDASDDGDGQQPTSIFGGTAKDTPDDDDASLDARISAAATSTGDEQSNFDAINVDVVKGRSPVPKEEIVDVAPTVSTVSKATKCEIGGRLCKDNLAGNTQKGGICNRCSKSDICDGCVTKCCGCKELICDQCRDGSDTNCHNILSYCEFCKEYKCGKCGAEDFEFICEDDPTEGSVCCECVEKAKRGHFGRYHQGCDFEEHDSRGKSPLTRLGAKEAEALGKCVVCYGNVFGSFNKEIHKCDRCSESSYMCRRCAFTCNICDDTICSNCCDGREGGIKELSYCNTCCRNMCFLCVGEEFDEGEDCSDCIAMKADY